MKITRETQSLCKMDERLFHALQTANILEHVMLHFYDRDYMVEWDRNERDKAAAIKLEVDKKCDALSRTYLTSLYGVSETWGFVGEESFHEAEQYKEYYWCVDPICGSLGYKKKTGNFGTSIALIHKNRAVLGVMNCPIRKWSGAAILEPSAHVAYHPCAENKTAAGVHIVVSANRRTNENLLEAVKRLGATRVTYAESIPVKALGVLLGKFDLFYGLPSRHGGGKYNVWDLAAVSAFAEAEKCFFSDAFGEPISLDPGKFRYHNGIILTRENKLWKAAVDITKRMTSSPQRRYFAPDHQRNSSYFVSGLKCAVCQKEFTENKGLFTCPDCKAEGVLDVQYDYEAVARVLTKPALARNPDMSHWRFLPLLPVPDIRKIPMLRVGGSPLYDAGNLAAEIDVAKLWIKDDGVNPTASLKDRASSIGVARALAENARGITCASTGNAASSLAGAAAAAGLPAFIFVPEKAPQAKIAQLLIFGANIFVVKGSYEDAFELSMFCANEFGFYNRNSGINPYLVEGKKTVSLEMCEQMKGDVPDYVFVAVGDGCSVAGVWKGFLEMQRLEFIKKTPILVGVQAKGASPIFKAWKYDKPMKPEIPNTLADSIAVGTPRNWRKAVNAVKESGGFYITVTDREILSAMKTLGYSSGVFGEPAGVTGLAGVIKAKGERLISRKSRVATIVTGNGLKDVSSSLKTTGKPYLISPDKASVKKTIMKICKTTLQFLIVLSFLLNCFQANADKVLNVFDFATTAAARAAWKPSSGVSEVGLYEGVPLQEKPGVRFPCNFSQVENRCYWDTNISEDLSSETLVKLRLYVENPLPISSFTLYFRSGSGWYSNTFGSLRKGWQVLSCARANFIFSGSPTGWHSIDGIRFSPWKGQGVDTEIIANELVTLNPKVAVVRGTKSSDQSTANSTTERISECLDAWGIEYGVMSEEDVETGALSGVRLAIFPYSNSMTPLEITQIQNFVFSGGKIIIFYVSPTEVFNLLGIQNLGFGGFSTKAMQFCEGVIDCVPPYVKQASWNFFKVNPVSPDVRVLAFWEDENGILTEHPAWTINNNGAYMSHILLSDDLENKKKLTLALVAHFVPQAAEGVVKNAWDQIGEAGEYLEFDEAVEGVRESAAQTPRISLVEDYLTSASRLRAEALESLTSGTFCQNLDAITSAKLHLLEAYYLAQKSEFPEFRAVWASYNSKSGPFVEGWDKMADDLARNGFHAVMPYMATGGVAYYDSAHLPLYDGYDVYGDHIADCVAACKPRGVQTHVRKLNYFLHNAPQSFRDDMRAQNRTQVDVDGNPVDWLCPSHPLNHQLELDVMLEIVDNYDIDGIHYDFIRYPGEKCCYCEGCRERFQDDTGIDASDWPLDCYSGEHKEAYREWRREKITKLARDMRTAVDQREKKIKISAAVFSSYPTCRTSVAQDWVSWIENGYLDFACPMNYTNSFSRFRNLAQTQMDYVGGRVPLYPGVGVASGSSSLTSDQAIAQLLITRQSNTAGFVIFVYGRYLSEEVLPNLRKGFTADSHKNALLFR